MLLPEAAQRTDALRDILDYLRLPSNEGRVGDVLSEDMSGLTSSGANRSERSEYLCALILRDACSLKKSIEPIECSDLLTALIDVRNASSAESLVPHVVSEQLVERLEEVIELSL
jgi:hypothetical protein